jgi:hypothetical protein
MRSTSRCLLSSLVRRQFTIALLVIVALGVVGSPVAASLPVRITASDVTSGDNFGAAIAIDGDTAIVGSPLDDDAGESSGAAYIYRWNGAGWTEEAKLVASDGAAGDQFGNFVAISGNTVIIDASGNDDAGSNSGSAYVFVRNGSTWTQQAKLVASDGAAGDLFGDSVAISGNTAIVGSPLDDDSGSNSGSAYVFVRNGSTWTQQAKLVASDGAAGDLFGNFVAISGNTVIIGASGNDDAGSNSGSAYVFVRNGSTWTQQAKLLASDGAAGDLFGDSVAISGNTAIVGSPLDDDSGSASGSAYVFVRNGSMWSQQAKLRASDGAEGDFFGVPVAINGDTAVVGSRLDDDSGTNSGSAYVFVRAGSTWTQQAKLLASDGAANDEFGFAVAIDGDTAIVGASGGDFAEVFQRIGPVWIGPDQKILAGDGAADDAFGFDVAIDGNLAIVGSAFDDDSGTFSGSAYIFVRTGSTWTQQAKLAASDDSAGDQFGFAVAISGGRAIVGAPGNDDAGSNSGSAYIFFTNGSIWIQQAKLVASDDAADDQFGFDVAISGDTAIVGANRDDDAGSDSGSAYVFVRNGSAWSQQAKLLASDGAPGDQFGGAVAIDGETAIVGAIGDDVAGTDSGSAYVFVRNGSAWSQQAKLVASDDAAGDQFGAAVGLDAETAIIGAFGDDVGGTNSGSAYVFVRNGATWIQQAKLITSDGATNDFFGLSVDVSGNTAIIGADADDDAGTNSGSAYLFVRNGSSWTERAKLAAIDGAAGDRFARSVAVSGETAIVGVEGDDDLGSGSGSAWLFHVGDERFSPLVYNATLEALYASLASAINAASPSHVLIATGSAFWDTTPTDYIAKPLSITGTGCIRQPYLNSITLANGASLNAASGKEMTLFGTLVVPSGAGSTLSASSIDLGSGGAMTILSKATLSAQASLLALHGEVALSPGATLDATGPIESEGGLSMLEGMLFAPSLRVGRAARLSANGSLITVGADFDVAINDNTRYDMSLAELRIGASSASTIERMSVDIGANAAGFDRTIAGHFPIGTLRINGSSATLVDVHDNDGQGQSACEALYVRHLIIEPGATLITNGCPVYYETLTLSGSVDNPANLIRINNCPGDTNGDGVVNFADLNAVLASFGQSGSTIPGDVNADGRVDFADLNLVLSNFGLPCPD